MLPSALPKFMPKVIQADVNSSAQILPPKKSFAGLAETLYHNCKKRLASYTLVSGTQPLVFFFFFFRAYSIENEGLGNSFTFFVTFPGMLAVTAELNK